MSPPEPSGAPPELRESKFLIFFSVLKYETLSNGAVRSLIIKNISKSDCAKYHCVADGAKSRTSTSFVIGGASSGFSKVPKIQGIF